MREPTNTAVPDVRDAGVLAGCMGLGGPWDDSPVTDEQVEQAASMVEAALAAGVTWFDHADIYTRGKAEAVFGQVLAARPDLRTRLAVQTKCGILLPGDGPLGSGAAHGRYDSSPDHVRRSVDASLERLGADRLDCLLVHRPDPFTHPAELAAVLDDLVRQGLVAQVGVSNHDPAQVAALQAHLEAPLVVDQLQLSLAHPAWLEAEVLVNTAEGATVGARVGALHELDAAGVRVQAWGALAGGRYSGRARSDATPAEQEQDAATSALVARLAAEHGTTPESVVLAWVQAHPVGIAPVVGTTSPRRWEACTDAVAGRVRLTRAEWYALWVSARGHDLP
ncbi:aldo/keto reductase [Kytococcus sp. Marseille-QA3725]